MEKVVQERESSSIDRISGLPEHILHKILCLLLSEKEVVKTCVLSKSWRHIVSTRPNLMFRQRFFKFKQNALVSALDNTLHQRYNYFPHQNIQNFVLEICSLNDIDSESKSLLDKWIPIVLLSMGVKAFTLHSFPKAFDVPWLVFKSQSLRKLVLLKCNLIRNPVDHNENIMLCKQLRILSLTKVNVTDHTFQNLMSSCPLIQSVTIHDCDGLRNIKVNKSSSYNLKRFDIRYNHDDSNNEEDHNIEIDVPTIKVIKISGCPNWNRHHNYFPHLKSLYLSRVPLSTLDGFSRNFPCLQMLTLSYCYGFEELRLLSPSIKRLNIWDHKSIKVDINAPNLLKFDYSGMIPQSISVKTNSSEWKSSITLRPYQIFGQDASSWLHKLHEMLKALSHSDICLYLKVHHSADQLTNSELYDPVYVRRLHMEINFRYSSSTPAFVDNVFCICRPRNIIRTLYFESKGQSKSDDTQLTELIWKILVTEREGGDYVWQQDLAEVSIEAFDWDGQNWNPVVGTGLIECAVFLPNKRRKLCFTLNWTRSS